MYKINSHFHSVEYSGSLYDSANWLNGTSFEFKDLGKKGIPIIKIKELKQGINRKTEYYTKNKKDEFKLKKGDLLYSWSGSPETSLDAYYFNLNEGLLNQHIFKITPKSFVTKQYFFYLLNYLKPVLVRIANDKKTTGLGHVTSQDLKNLKIQIPKKKYQDLIVNILQPIYDKIELNKQMNLILEKITNALFKSWFIDFDPVIAKVNKKNIRLSKQVNNLFPDSFEDSELFKIPKGWKISKLGDHINLIKGKSYKSSELQESKTALVTLKSFQRNGGYRKDGLKEYIGSFKPEQVVKDGDLVVAFTDVTQSADVIGKPAIIIGDKKYDCLVISLDVGTVRILEDSDLSISFIYYLMMSNEYDKNSLGYVNGTNVLHLKKEAITDFKFPLPPKKILEEFNNLSYQVIKKVSKNSETNIVLNQLMETLIPKLISGEIKISDAKKLISKMDI